MNKIITHISEYRNLLKKTSVELLNEAVSEYDRFYHLYEYTDDICVLEDNLLYPGLLNYVRTGLLTKKELTEALEYDKGLEQ